MNPTSASAKIILLGEHFVAHASPAIAFTLNELNTKVQIKTSKKNNHNFNIKLLGPYNLSFTEKQRSDMVKKCHILVDELLTFIGLPNALPPMEFNISSNIPVEQGFGSSAALCVAITKEILKLLPPFAIMEDHRKNKIIEFTSLQLEKIFHETPSGIDTTTITYDRLIYFQKNSPHIVPTLGNDFYFVIVSTGHEHRATKQLIKKVREYKNKNINTFDKYIEEASWVTLRGVDALSMGDTKLLGNIMNRYQELLSKIGVTSELTEQYCKIALENGASGAKISGAGGKKGAVIALVELSKINNVLKAWQKLDPTFITTHKVSKHTAYLG